MKKHFVAAALLILSTSTSGLIADDRPDVLIADFDQPRWPIGWTTEGNAFDGGPVPPEAEVARISALATEGRLLLTPPGSTGRLTTAPFTINRNYLNMRIGGGRYGGTRVEVHADGQMIARSHEPRMNRALYHQTIDMRELETRTQKGVFRTFGETETDGVGFETPRTA